MADTILVANNNACSLATSCIDTIGHCAWPIVSMPHAWDPHCIELILQSS